ncbi:MAG: ABC transporter ATP-binding protein [Anaerolineae bacterium]|nr:ABC transporter ATP-binding protein [Anaerolineae bacterium]
MNEWLIETRNLTRVYGNGAEVCALDGVDLQVAAGELVAVMGPSGSGKSTLLNMLGALDLPTGGQVLVNGQDLAHIKDKDEFRAHVVGFVFQLHNLLPTLTAQENVEVPMMGRLGAGARGKRAAELLELVGLADRGRHLPGQLSGGQRQRVAIARALANDPPLVLADEPTGALDSVSGQELMRLVSDLNRSQGTTFVVVTHDANVARQTRRIIHMRDGRIIGEDHIGSPLEEDLKMWRRSVLGQLILNRDLPALAELGLAERQIKQLGAALENHD